jgi:hypothetical protein
MDKERGEGKGSVKEGYGGRRLTEGGGLFLEGSLGFVG